MYRRTFEVIAKYISKETNVKIQFDTDEGAHSDMKNKTLHLPKKIANKHAYAALSLAMHEAAHIQHSGIIPIKEVANSSIDFSILNAMEDIRIDRHNFARLPNIFEFYKELVKEIKANVDMNAPVAARALCHSILDMEGFQPRTCFGKDAKALSKKIEPYMCQGWMDIERRDWASLKESIQAVKQILNIPSSQDQPMPKKAKDGEDKTDGPLGDVEKMMRPGSVFSLDGDEMQGGSVDDIGSIAMEDMQANQFKEILNIKEKKTIDNGSILDTGSLTSYRTGDVGELFKEDRVVKKKKSKIYFLLDGSGSMQNNLLDGKSRSYVVKKSVSKMIEILNEVSAIEGLNVDWDIGRFTTDLYPLSKESWQSEYRASGGTCFCDPFIQVMDTMLKDYTIDGKRIIIALTDGDVADYEVDYVKQAIMQNFSDVRALLISVGGESSGKMATEITGDNIIYSEEDATFVIMETIKSLL